jgi:hypothetical protein
MSYDYSEKKTVIVLSTAIEIGVALNVVGHLCVSLGARVGSEVMGREQLTDASGIAHRGIAKYPIIITKVKPARLRQVIEEARAHPNLLLGDYPEEMLTTGHDDELAAEIAAKSEAALNYLGVALYGDANLITQLTGKFTLYK